jgi:hypothetical protein
MLLSVVGSDAYKWWLAFHTLLAVVWVGSDVAIQIIVIRARRAGPDRLAYLAGEIECGTAPACSFPARSHW